MASLIQQRMAIDRTKKWGIFQICFGAFLMAACIVYVLLNALDLIALAEIAVGVYVVISGIRQFRKGRQVESVFNAENGEDAGVQHR
jgi:predicted phage tail protein